MTSCSAVTSSCGLMTPTGLQRNRLMMTDTEHVTAGQWVTGAGCPGQPRTEGGPSAPNMSGPHACSQVGCVRWPERARRRRGSATFRKSKDREAFSIFRSKLCFRGTSSHCDLYCFDRGSFQSLTCYSGLCWVVLIAGNRHQQGSLEGPRPLKVSVIQIKHYFIYY